MIAEIICAEWRKNQAWRKAIKILIAPATAPIFERMTVFEQGETPEEGGKLHFDSYTDVYKLSLKDPSLRSG